MSIGDGGEDCCAIPVSAGRELSTWVLYLCTFQIQEQRQRAGTSDSGHGRYGCCMRRMIPGNVSNDYKVCLPWYHSEYPHFCNAKGWSELRSYLCILRTSSHVSHIHKSRFSIYEELFVCGSCQSCVIDVCWTQTEKVGRILCEDGFPRHSPVPIREYLLF